MGSAQRRHERHRAEPVVLFLIIAWACLACGLEQDITLEAPEENSPEGSSVGVFWDDQEAEVFLGPLDRVDFEGRPVCLLWDVLLAAGLEEQDILGMRFDFEGSDGFRSSSVGCSLLEGELMRHGYLDPESLALLWEADLHLRGCYWLNGAARILGEPAEATSDRPVQK